MTFWKGIRAQAAMTPDHLILAMITLSRRRRKIKYMLIGKRRGRIAFKRGM